MPIVSTQLHFQPIIPARLSASAPFTQTIRLHAADEPIGQCTWHHAGESAIPGVAQIIDLRIENPNHRRQGHGHRLLDAAIKQATRHGQAIHQPLRQIWLAVPHTQTIARAFLTKTGFHHVSSLKNLHPEMELLVYVRSMD